MSTYRYLIGILALGLPITALAQNTEQIDVRSFRGGHQIELSFGLLSDLRVTSEVGFGNWEARSEANGLIGSLAYSYWFTDDWAFSLSVGVANADASTSVSGGGSSMESAAVVPLLFGVKYGPRGLAIGSALRPYAFAYVGPYFGFASGVHAGPDTGTESYVETAPGSRFGVGLQLSLSRRFTLGFAAGYRLVGDFDRRIGSEENYSSPELSFGLGIFVGKMGK